VLVKPIIYQASISEFGDAWEKAAVIPENILLAALLGALVRNAEMLGRFSTDRKHYVKDVWLFRPGDAVENTSHGAMQPNK